MLFLLAFQSCLHRKFLHQASEGSSGRSELGHDLRDISFCYLFLLHDGREHGMNKAVLSSKCIHSFNEFLKIMEPLLGNGEIIHSQGSMQIYQQKQPRGRQALHSGTHLNEPAPYFTWSLEGQGPHMFAQRDPWFQGTMQGSESI